jgi:hypothetical protein
VAANHTWPRQLASPPAPTFSVPIVPAQTEPKNSITTRRQPPPAPGPPHLLPLLRGPTTPPAPSAPRSATWTRPTCCPAPQVDRILFPSAQQTARPHAAASTPYPRRPRARAGWAPPVGGVRGVFPAPGSRGRSTTRKAASASIPPPNLTSPPVSLELSLSGGQGDGRQARDSAHELPPPPPPPPRRPRPPISPRAAANSGEACSPPPPEARAPCRLRAWLGSGFDSVPAGVPPSGCGNSRGGFSHSASVLCGCRRARWRVQSAAICLGLDWPVDSFLRGVKLSEAACARWGSRIWSVFNSAVLE